jgi:hypothetical protein
VTKVTGTVKHEKGGPVAGATVEVHNSAGDIVDQVRTADDGTFTYHLSLGNWVFKTYDGDSHRGERTVTLKESDATISVDLVIG